MSDLKSFPLFYVKVIAAVRGWHNKSGKGKEESTKVGGSRPSPHFLCCI